jgi:putative FmdB family regulatory protein
MPVYEFRCRKCGKEFEERRLFSESDKPGKCPACGGAGDKLISGFGFKLGFYTRPSEAPMRSSESTWSGDKPTPTKPKGAARRAGKPAPKAKSRK